MDMDSFGEDIVSQSGKGYGLNFLMDYNEERMAKDIAGDLVDEDLEAMIYIETLGKNTATAGICHPLPTSFFCTAEPQHFLIEGTVLFYK